MLYYIVLVFCCCCLFHQSCKTEEVEEKQRVIKNCPLLHHVSPAVLTKLANVIIWETIPANSSKMNTHTHTHTHVTQTHIHIHAQTHSYN